MSDQVDASPQDVRQLAGSLAAYKQDISSASKKVEGALKRAKWHDSRKTQFEDEFRDLQKKLDRFMSSEVDEMIRGLKQLATKLDEIRGVRM